MNLRTEPPGRRRLALAGALALLLGATACNHHNPVETPLPGPVTFRFGMADDPTGTEDFLAVTEDPEVIARVRAELQRPAGERALHISGPISAGDGGHNLSWGWHFDPGAWDVVEVSVELCDGRPGDIEKDLAYWLDVVGSFCPWGSRVKGEETVGLAAAP